MLLLGAAWLKTRLGVDEVVTTLLANFIVLLFVSMMLDGPMKDATAMGWPQSVPLVPELELSKLMARSRVHSGLLLAGALAVILWAVNRFTVFGLQMRAVGANARAAAFAGIAGAARDDVGRAVVGRAGGIGRRGGGGRAYQLFSRSIFRRADGYAGVVIAMLAGLHPLGVVAASVFVAGVLVGADGMSRAVGVPNSIADVIVAVALLAMLVATMLTRYRIRFDARGKAA
ncbi:ABC transporter permease subunit [Cupriavidus basilensis]